MQAGRSPFGKAGFHFPGFWLAASAEALISILNSRPKLITPLRRIQLTERRNPSAEDHGEPMSEGEPLPIVHPWARAIRYRPSLVHDVAVAQG